MFLIPDPNIANGCSESVLKSTHTVVFEQLWWFWKEMSGKMPVSQTIQRGVHNKEKEKNGYHVCSAIRQGFFPTQTLL